MRLKPAAVLYVLLVLPAVAFSLQTPEPSATPTMPPKPKETPPAAVPRYIEGYIVTTEIQAIAPELKTPGGAPGEAQALASQLRAQAQLVSRFTLAQDFSRQEIVSTDFVLPAGTFVQHKAGDRFYTIADPKTKSYLVMDAETLLTALEGGAGIVNSQYEAKVQHTSEKKTVAGMPCKKSIVTVTYASTVPFENTTVLVQQKNDIEVWHTAGLVSSGAMDHFFFKFQRDKTGAVRKVLAAELGFPMEVNLVVTQGSAKKPAAQSGSFHFVVTDVKIDKKMNPDVFQIPPPSYHKVEKSPYFKDGALSAAAAKLAAEEGHQ